MTVSDNTLTTNTGSVSRYVLGAVDNLLSHTRRGHDYSPEASVGNGSVYDTEVKSCRNAR